jgi:hypothetical protein
MRKLWLAPCLALSLWAGDISGKWTGVIEVNDTSSGTTVKTPVKANFDQKTDAISGSIGRKEDEEVEPIHNAKLSGKTLMFEVRSPETTGAVKFNLVLVSDNRIEGDMKGAIGTGPIAGKVKLTKEPAQ